MWHGVLFTGVQEFEISAYNNDVDYMYKSALAMLHVVAGAIPTMPLALALMSRRGAAVVDNADFLRPPLLPQLQSRLVRLQIAFDVLVRTCP